MQEESAAMAFADAVVAEHSSSVADVAGGGGGPLPPSDDANVVVSTKRVRYNDEEDIDQYKKQKAVNDATAVKKYNSEQWDAMFERLQAYKLQHGDCLVPKRYSDEPKLGTWVETQRVQYKRLQREWDESAGTEAVTPNNRLNQERLAKLNSIGFAWSAKNVKKVTTTSVPAVSTVPPAIAATKMMPKTSSSLPSPPSPTEGRPAAAAGSNKPAKRSPSDDTKPKKKQPSTDLQWEEMYQRLVHYRHMYGDCLVPRKYEADPKLATWVENQRVLWNRDYREKSSSSPYFDGLERQASATSTVASSSYQPMEMATTVWHDVAPPPPPQECRDDDAKPAAAAATAAVRTTAPPPVATVEYERNTMNTSLSSNNNATKTEHVSHDQALVAAAVAAATEAVDHARRPVTDNNPMTTTGVGRDNLNNALSKFMSSQQSSSSKPQRLSQERKNRLDALGFVWSLRSKRIDDHWDQMFRQLCEYKAQFGDCLVPSRYEANLKLGKWVETQRYEYTKLQRSASGAVQGWTEEDVVTTKPSNASAAPSGTGVTATATGGAVKTNPRLTEERLGRLEAIGFEWKVKHKMKRYYDKQWEQMLDRLLQFKAANGHCMVPKRYPPEMKLGTWVHTQRIQYRKLMAGSNKKEAEAADKEWKEYVAGSKQEAEAAGDPEWKEYAELGYFADGGGGNVANKAGASVDEISFRLTEDRRKRLEEVGFVWSARENEKSVEQGRVTRNSYDDQWDAMFARLVAYKDKYGDCLVPKRCKVDAKLGTWVDTQRVQYKKLMKKLAERNGTATAETTSPKSEDGDAESDTSLPDGSNHDSAGPGPDNKSSAKPVVGRLTDERISRLNELGFVWSLRDDWKKHYEELKEFKNEYGHCNVPARYTKNRRLGIWVSAQRQQFKLIQAADATSRRSAPLTQERIDLLNQLGFTWTIRSRDSLGESWNQRLQDLIEFKRTYGHCLVPSRFMLNPELGIWVGTQRTQYRLYMKAKETGQKVLGASSMNEERIRQLEDIGFVWALRSTDAKKEHDVETKATAEYAEAAAAAQHDTSDGGEQNHLYEDVLAQVEGAIEAAAEAETAEKAEKVMRQVEEAV